MTVTFQQKTQGLHSVSQSLFRNPSVSFNIRAFCNVIYMYSVISLFITFLIRAYLIDIIVLEVDASAFLVCLALSI